LLLFYSSYGDHAGLSGLAKSAEEAGKYNVAFEAAFVVQDVDRCLNILVKAKRMGEAAMFAKAHTPSRLAEVTQKWAALLKEQGLPFQPEMLNVSDQDLQHEQKLREVYGRDKQPAAQL
jgi:coatomer subunit beta'